jgi:hypothetical protein
MEVYKTVQGERRCEHSETSNVVTGIREAEVSERVTPHKLQETGISYSSCRKAAKTMQVFLYKVHVTQQLVPPECEKRHHYCEWLLAKLEDDHRILTVAFTQMRRDSILQVMWTLRILAYGRQRNPIQPIKLLFTL